jgi:telomerase reverse transcriptase
MRGEYFVQKEGISQGSILSTLLASIYLADLEATYRLTHLSDELLVRRMDDYLFVTPHLHRWVIHIKITTNSVSRSH